MRYAITTVFLSSGLFLQPMAIPLAFAESTTNKSFDGYVFLAAEAKGELWYIRPATHKRTYFANPTHVLFLMQNGLGISNDDLQKIPVAVLAETTIDTDKDGLSDALEYALNLTDWKMDTDGDGVNDGVEVMNHSNPKGPGTLPVDLKLAQRLSGLIVLQVQDRGQAWYIHPVTKKRYALGTPPQALNTLTKLSVGITNANLEKIPIE